MRNYVLLLIVVLIGVFAGVNWPTFEQTQDLNLIVTHVTAPFGILLLIIMGVLLIIYFLYTVGLETSALLEVRKYARELSAQRKLVEDAESSRFTELKRFLESELSSMKSQHQEVLDRLEQRAQATEAVLKEELEKVGNTLAAYIGELEDRLTRGSSHEP